MPKINYIIPDGSTLAVDVPVGQTVMDGSVRNNLPGILAECGGGCSCATCHVWIDDNQSAPFDEAAAEERELLEQLDGFSPTRSRLSCQLVVSDEHDEITVTVAPSGD